MQKSNLVASSFQRRLEPGKRPVREKRARSQSILPVGLAVALTVIGCCGVALADSEIPPARTRSDADAAFACTTVPSTQTAPVTVYTTLAGVPAIVRIPVQISRPPIVLWHGFGIPADTRALMEALPLDGVPAVKVYLGLPLFGSRAPAGGNAELARRQAQEFATRLFEPAVVGAADELPAVIAALQQRGCMASGQRISLFGFSAGGAAALIALIQGKAAVSAAVLVNASTGLTASVEALERATAHPYTWTPASRALARRTDAVQHASDIARGHPPPALLIVQGERDAVLTAAPAVALNDALLPCYRDGNGNARLKLMSIPGMSHGWTGDEHAAAMVRRATTDWFNEYR